jgi:DNA-binding transcriptional MerR regulator
MSHAFFTIGETGRKLGLSADTLRYYEKIGLLPKIGRNPSGVRQYTEKDLSRLRFIQRAQKMNFSLAEIAQLLKMREDPQHARNDIREMTATKLAQIEEHMNELGYLRKELTLLLNLCRNTEGECPIIENLQGDDAASTDDNPTRD